MVRQHHDTVAGIRQLRQPPPKVTVRVIDRPRERENRLEQRLDHVGRQREVEHKHNNALAHHLLDKSRESSLLRDTVSA